MDQMKRMAITWGILAVLIFGMLTIYGFMFTKKNKDYKELEEKIVDAAKKFGDENFVYSAAVDGVKVTYKDLVDNGYIEEELKVKEDVCDGYAMITYKNYVYEYEAFIKCDKYTSKGY